MNIRKEWMSDNQYFGNNYPNNLLLDEAKRRFDVQRYQSLEGYDVIIDGVTERVVIQNHTNPLNQSKYDKKIHCTIDSNIHTGSIVEWQNKKWLVVSKIYDNLAYKTASILECNSTLNVYKNSILYKVPCIVEDAIRLYSMGTDENKYIIQPSTDIIIRVPNNEVTTLIKRDEVYKIGLSNYKVVDISDIINPGLLILKCTWSAEDQHLPNYSINILNGDSIQVNGSDSLQIICEVLDGDVVLSPTPPLVYLSSDETIATIDNNGVVSILSTGVVTFTVSLESDTNIKDTITVEFVDVLQYNYVVTISGNTSIVKGKTATYTATFTDNGQVITQKSFFYLTGDDGVSTTTLATITSQDSVNNTCVVTAGNTLGYVKLWCKNTAGNIVSQPYRIQIRNIF